MKPISASGSFILFLITALSVKAGSLANDSLPHREASLTSVDVPRQNEGLVNNATDFKAILRIIQEENARAQNALKEEVAKCKCDYGYTGENCNEELDLCETTLFKKHKGYAFGCYRVGAKKHISKCWRMCNKAVDSGCGKHGWCNIIDSSKCTLSQIKKVDCVYDWLDGDRKACPEKFKNQYCDDRVGVSYGCNHMSKCWRSCDSDEEGCSDAGWCYVNEGFSSLAAPSVNSHLRLKKTQKSGKFTSKTLIKNGKPLGRR